MRKESLGDRMKQLEEDGSTCSRFIPLLPVIGRIDGRAFHSFTKDLKRPYDEALSNLMIEMTKFIVGETGALIGYTQSDEASFLWYSEDYKSQIFFNGRAQKMNSNIASLATGFFNENLGKYLPKKKEVSSLTGKFPIFDCRVYNLPVAFEVANYFLWRERDATKNSISMAAQSMYSHTQLHKKSGSEKQEMLHEKGVNWNDYPRHFKRGTYIQRKKEIRGYTAEEMARLSDRHPEKNNPGFTFERSIIKELDMPVFEKVTNRIEVIFKGADPELLES